MRETSQSIARAQFLARDHALLDEQGLERARREPAARQRASPFVVVRVIVIVRVVTHEAASSQCSKTSAYTRSRCLCAVGPELTLCELDKVEAEWRLPVVAVGARLRGS